MNSGESPGADELFEVDPEEFVAARDALARRLRGAGQREEAAAVKALRRPTVSAWALNQLARRHGDEVRALVVEGQELAQAQSRALAGDDAGFREAASNRREAIRRLARRADEILAARSAATHREEVVGTLTAASVDPDVAEQLLGGRLTAPIAAVTGFEGTAVAPPAPPPKRAARPKGGATDGRDEAAAERARAEAAEAQRAADEAQERADEAAAEAEQADLAAAASEAEVERLEAALAEARRVAGDHAREARTAAKRAGDATRQAEAAAERARPAAGAG